VGINFKIKFMKRLLILLFIPIVCFGQNDNDSNKVSKEAISAIYYIDVLGNPKYKSGDFYGAIADYSKAIEIDVNSETAYGNRGLAKFSLKDFYGAIADYNKAIEINSSNVSYYSRRASAKKKIEDNYGAIADLTMVIKLETEIVQRAEAYFHRGVIKGLLGNMEEACKDIKVAESLGYDISEIAAACYP
jgi:tetratricopeptide (TPR) repeat protein